MPTLTHIEPCDPPVHQRDQATGPSTPLDHEILRFLSHCGGPAELGEITRGIGGTTHRVHARVQALLDRGLVHRRPITGGPKRGPGASVYTLTAAGRAW